MKPLSFRIKSHRGQQQLLPSHKHILLDGVQRWIHPRALRNKHESQSHFLILLLERLFFHDPFPFSANSHIQEVHQNEIVCKLVHNVRFVPNHNQSDFHE